MAAGPVSVVVFDLGGVLIDWDPRRLYRGLFPGDEPAMERFLAEICTAAWNHELDAGRSSFAEAVAELSLRHPHERERIEAYHRRWVEMLGGPIPGTVAILEELAARGVPVFAITNWSAETFLLVRQDPAYGFLDHFREIFVSGTLRMVKPSPPIFRHALERIGEPATACLFVDDLERNTEAAAALGFATHRFTAPDALGLDLRARGLLA